VSDCDQLRALVQSYARAIDARDIPGLRALFHPGAVIEGSARGRQPLREWLEAMAGPRAYPASMHFLGDPLIRLEGDTAELDTYAVVYQLGSGGPELTLGIRYLDTAIRTDGAWVFINRRAETLWSA
jgi:hypothetical protein